MEWNLRRMESELRHINPDLLQPSKSFKKPSSGTITLNVGGFLYTAHRTTLAKHQGSFLEELANGKKPVQHTDSMGNPFIDRDGPVFRHVLNYLRTGELQLPDDFREAGLLRREASFYHLTELVEAVTDWESQRAAQREPAFLEVTDSHERSQGLKVYCSDPGFIDKVKGRLVQISKSRLDGFPEEFVSRLVCQVAKWRVTATFESTACLTLPLSVIPLHGDCNHLLRTASHHPHHDSYAHIAL
ncbi:hypothetical protein INR49_025154 [Caranx melampygus]|nr:hypothetical protein INR49_025154 [Caranx melampygus]